MLYSLMGRVHAAIAQGLRGERGQGTVEYVALILLVAAVLGAVVAAGSKAGDQGIAKAIVNKLKTAIETVGGARP